MIDLKAPVMSPELMAAVSSVETLIDERDRIAGILATEREKFRSHEATLEGIRANLAASESELALSGGVPDQKLRSRFIDSREEAELIAARIEGVAARLAVVERDLADARAQLSRVFEQWRSAEANSAAERLVIAMQALIEEVVITYATAAGLNDSFSRRTLTAIRGLTLFDPTAPTSKALFHGSSLRGGRFRTDEHVSELHDAIMNIRLEVSNLLGADAGQAEVSAEEQELSR